MKNLTAIVACLMLSACAGTANIVDHGNVKEIVYAGFIDPPTDAANLVVMQTLSNKQCPGGYAIVSQKQTVKLGNNSIKWVIKCQ